MSNFSAVSLRDTLRRDVHTKPTRVIRYL